MSVERVLLQSIRFDLQVDHPYNYLLDIAKHMKGIVFVTYCVHLFIFVIVGEKQRIEQVLQMAWTFINDRYMKLQ